MMASARVRLIDASEIAQMAQGACSTDSPLHYHYYLFSTVLLLSRIIESEAATARKAATQRGRERSPQSRRLNQLNVDGALS